MTSLDMGLFGFQTRPVSGPEIVGFGGLNGLNPIKNQVKAVTGLGPFKHQKSTISGPETRRI